MANIINLSITLAICIHEIKQVILLSNVKLDYELCIAKTLTSSQLITKYLQDTVQFCLILTYIDLLFTEISSLATD